MSPGGFPWWSFWSSLEKQLQTHRLTGDLWVHPGWLRIYGCFLPGFGGNVGGSCRSFFLEKKLKEKRVLFGFFRCFFFGW